MNRHHVNGVAILVDEFVEQVESTSRVAGRDPNDGRAPFVVHEPAAGDVVGVGDRRLAGMRFEIVENAQLLKISSQIAIVTLVHGDKRIFRGDGAEQASGFYAPIEIVPGVHRLPTIDLAPSVQNLLQPVFDFLGR